MNTINLAFSAILFVLTTFGCVVLFQYGGVVRHLKKQHVDTWVKLGKPGILFGDSIRDNLTFFAFLKNREYLELNDSFLSRRSKSLWFLLRVYMVMASILLLVAVALILASSES